MIQNIGLVINNKRYTEKVCYNISMIDLIEVNNIEELKIEITKTIIHLTKNHDQYHIEEFYNCEQIFRTIRLLDNMRTLLESL